MKNKNKVFGARVISAASLLSLLFGGLISQPVHAAVSNPTPVCVGSSCSVTFSAAGDYYSWSPPAGAKNLTFDLMGAQGGRLGGQGGRVAGALTSVPSQLLIYVGGAGAQGAGSVGGFNGGGNAGSGRGDEGSGGGATDIRSTTALGDRIAIAAGGGGSGGYAGGTGGAGGGLSGVNGVSGQGEAGRGASQSAGGNGGFPNGGTWGLAGGLGSGGSGGSSTVSGGGGGGGGFYGGGGGGADVDTCCSNAGGGGGGSSWANPAQVSSVVHTAGYRAGAGLAVISYLMPPSVLSFTTSKSITNSTDLTYNLTFNETVLGLSSTDFITTGSTAVCANLTVSGSAANYVVTALNCTEGSFKISLAANSVTGSILGPTQISQAADVLIERVTPTLQVLAPSSPSASQELNYSLTFSEPVTGLDSSDFQVTGSECQIGSLTGSSANYTFTVNGCADGATLELNMSPNSVIDLAQNSGPSVAPIIPSVVIDRSVADPVWSVTSLDSYDDPQFEITFSETVIGFARSDLVFGGTSSNCEYSLVEQVAGQRYKLQTLGCGIGNVQASIPIGSYADALGNQGPAVASNSALVTKAAIPVVPTPIPTPAPIPTPVATPIPTPTPIPTSVPIQVPPAAEPIALQVIEPAPPPVQGIEIEAQTQPEPVPAQQSELESEQVSEELLIEQSELLTEGLSVSNSAPSIGLIQQPKKFALPNLGTVVLEESEAQILAVNPTIDKKSSQTLSLQFWLPLITITGAVALGIVSLMRIANQIKTRRLIRRFV